MILPKTFSLKNIKIKLNSITWMTLKSLGVIFQALKLCSLNDLNSLNNLNGLNDLDSLISSKKILILGWIISGTKMTNTRSFLLNRSSIIQFFTNIWYLICQRLLRPADTIFLKTCWWNSNGKTSWTHHPP